MLVIHSINDINPVPQPETDSSHDPCPDRQHTGIHYTDTNNNLLVGMQRREELQVKQEFRGKN